MRFYLRVVSVFRKDWPLISLFLALIGLSIAIGLLQAWPMAVLVDAVLTPAPRYGWVHHLFLFALPKSMLAQVIGVTLIGMFLKIVQDGLTLIKNLLNRRIEYNGLIRVRCQLFRKLQALGPDYHKSQPQGDAIYRVTSDANGFKDALNILINTAVSGITLVVMILIMLSRNVPLTVFALSIFPVLLVINRVFGPRIKTAALTSKQQETDYTTTLQRSMSVISVMQAFARETREFGRFKLDNLRCAGGWMKLEREKETYWFLVRTVFSLGGAIIFGYGGYLVYRDQFVLHRTSGLTCGDLMVFMAYLGGLWGPLTDLTSFSANIQPPAAAVERVMSVLNRQPRVSDGPAPLPLPRQPRTLELHNVTFAYRKETPVLRGINATITPGQMVAFVGPSGAGKSTLLNLLNRCYDPSTGGVLIDGRDLRAFKLADVRRHVAVVSQDSLLLSGTVRENITYGHSHASQAEIDAACELAGADEFIRDLPDSYDTLITEGGQNLSGGQRQRLAIARALVTESPILVLDEPTSSLDPQHAQQITRTLHKVRQRSNRTIVLVTHHLASVARCDQIFVLEAGQIVEHGTHDELLELDGVYAAMLRAEPTPDKPRPRLHEAA
jgi:subfamily B ATP-binding cassette protein MsbA